MSNGARKTNWLNNFQKKHDWSGIYCLEPEYPNSRDEIRFNSGQYHTIPEQITVKSPDKERHFAIKLFLDENDIPHEAGDFSKGEGIKIFKNVVDKEGNLSLEKFYVTVCDYLSGRKNQEKVEGRLDPDWVAVKIHEKLFGPLLIHPMERIMRGGDMSELKRMNQLFEELVKKHGYTEQDIGKLKDRYIEIGIGILELSKKRGNNLAM